MQSFGRLSWCCTAECESYGLEVSLRRRLKLKTMDLIA